MGSKILYHSQGDRVVKVTHYGKVDMELLLELTNDRMINAAF
ncbi:MAG: hypothetical protein U9Q80_10235 [Bacillota bacterium]|nr:hypothetical protein [Bacillota bacterium]